MITRVDTPQSRCRAGFARADITPPVGIYHRMWGAATHDTAEGVHKLSASIVVVADGVRSRLRAGIGARWCPRRGHAPRRAVRDL